MSMFFWISWIAIGFAHLDSENNETFKNDLLEAISDVLNQHLIVVMVAILLLVGICVLVSKKRTQNQSGFLVRPRTNMGRKRRTVRNRRSEIEIQTEIEASNMIKNSAIAESTESVTDSNPDSLKPNSQYDTTSLERLWNRIKGGDNYEATYKPTTDAPLAAVLK